jgi:hypothetical protein
MDWDEISLLSQMTSETASKFQDSMVNGSENEIDTCIYKHVENLNYSLKKLIRPMGLDTEPIVCNRWVWLAGYYGTIVAAIYIGQFVEDKTQVPGSSEIVGLIAENVFSSALNYGESSIMNNVSFHIAKDLKIAK